MKRLTVIPIIAAVVLLAGAAFAVHHHRPPKPKPTPTPSPVSGQCDAALLQHVYHPARLKVIAPCRMYSGVIEFDRAEADGDHHVLIKPDDPSVVNSVNVAQQHGDLVIEPVCIGTVTQADAVSACQGFKSKVTIPPVGTRVSVTGQYVTDTQHGGWSELHPVTSITVLGKLSGASIDQAQFTDWVDDNGDA